MEKNSSTRRNWRLSRQKARVTNTMFAETFYYITIPVMILIHAGFLA